MPVRVSKCHRLTVLQLHLIFVTLNKILIFVCAKKRRMHFNRFLEFFFYMYHINYVIFGVISYFFKRKRSKLGFDSVTNPHLECLLLVVPCEWSLSNHWDRGFLWNTEEQSTTLQGRHTQKNVAVNNMENKLTKENLVRQMLNFMNQVMNLHMD